MMRRSLLQRHSLKSTAALAWTHCRTPRCTPTTPAHRLAQHFSMTAPARLRTSHSSMRGCFRQTVVRRQPKSNDADSMTARLNDLMAKRRVMEKTLEPLVEQRNELNRRLVALFMNQTKWQSRVDEGTKEEMQEAEQKLHETKQEIKGVEQKIEKMEQEIKEVEQEIEKMEQEIKALEDKLAPCASWTLETFLKRNLSCGDAFLLSREWRSFCKVLPSDVSEYLQRVCHPLPAETGLEGCNSKWKRWPYTFVKTDDEYRLLMANVVGSLIRRCTLKALIDRIEYFTRPPHSMGAFIAVSTTLCDSLEALAPLMRTDPRQKISEDSFRFSRYISFDLEVTLRETSLMQFADRTLCPSAAIIFEHRQPLTRALSNLPTDGRVYNEEVLTKAPDGKLRLVCGASGSGKTMAALLSAGREGIVMYTLASQYKSAENATREERDSVVRANVVARVTRLVENATIKGRFDGKVVLVIDEAGDRPVMVRSLCRIHQSVCRELAKVLLVDEANLSLLVCGTGVERPDGAPESMPWTYDLINMSHAVNESKFFDHFLELISTRCGCPRLAAILRDPKPKTDKGTKEGTASTTGPAADIALLQHNLVVVRCRRMLQNRRMAAIFYTSLFEYACRFRENNDEPRAVDQTMVWPLQLQTLMQRMLWNFRQTNGLACYSTDQIKALHAAALAMCLGGPLQYKEVNSTFYSRAEIDVLFSRTGMLLDNRILHNDSTTLVAPEEAGKPGPGEAQLSYGLCCEDAKTMDQHGMRCFAMTSAIVEAGLCAFHDIIAPTQMTAAGFEQTLGKVAHLWQRALASGIRINLTIPSELPIVAASKLKDCTCAFAFLELLRWVGETEGRHCSRVAHIELVDPVTSVQAAWIAADHDANVADGTILRTVIVNGPNAPFGDVIVVFGRKGETTAQRCLIVKAKQRLEKGNPLWEYEAAHEHYKNGIVDAITIAGYAFVSAQNRYGISREVDKLTGDAAAFARCLYRAGVYHGVDLKTLTSDLSNVTVPATQPNEEPPQPLAAAQARINNKRTVTPCATNEMLSHMKSVKQTAKIRDTPVEVRSVVLCAAEESVECSHDSHGGWHTIVLNEWALKMALRPVELELSPFANCSDEGPRKLFDLSSSVVFEYLPGWESPAADLKSNRRV